jgi:hypothetical protein
MSEIKKFQIVRKSDGYRHGAEAVLTTDPTPTQQDGLDRMLGAGVLDGAEFTTLCNFPGFALVHSWLKEDYPLPLHSHSADGLYYIISGSARLGTETLGPGDCVFIPANTPYTYRAGPDGLEFLEFRHTLEADYRNYAKNAAFYDKAVATILANRDAWRDMVRPERCI